MLGDAEDRFEEEKNDTVGFQVGLLHATRWEATVEQIRATSKATAFKSPQLRQCHHAIATMTLRGTQTAWSRNSCVC